MFSKGQSIIELMIAMAIFVLISSAMAALVLGGFQGMMQGGQQTQAAAIAQEGLEAVRSIRDSAWNKLVFSMSSVFINSDVWALTGEGTTETIGLFTRTINFSDVCRDALSDIAICPSLSTDPHSKLVSSVVSWERRQGVTNLVQQSSYLTNWDSNTWTQTDWSGGVGQAIWSNISMYDSGDSNIDISSVGEAKLTYGGSSDSGFNFAAASNYDWQFITSVNYTFDSNKVEVTGGYGQLKSSGGSSASDATINSEFTTSSDGWTFSTWGAGGGEITPTGAWQSAGGNSGGYIEVDMPYNSNNDEVGGYFEQAIFITEDGATVSCYIDWSITQWIAASGVNDYQIYLFLDTLAGDPIIGNEVWSSGTQSGTTAWSSEQSIDCSFVATTNGTYYYKVAVWFDSLNKNTGPITVGFDNTKVFWNKITGGSYPTDEPTIYPVSSYSAAGVTSWDSFTEIAVKNGGEIYYQLSNNDGSTWQYWNGSAWAVISGATDYNTTAVVNSNIGSFSVSGEQIKFRVFLVSDGSQFVRLDNIQISFTAADIVWSFNNFDIVGGEVIPTGSRQTSSGNPDNYVDVVVPRGDGDEVGGYWEQAFITTVNNPSVVDIGLDYKVVDFNDTPNVAQIRVYLDTTIGTPTNQVGFINLSSEGLWTSATTINAPSAITTIGTYYLKIAFWVETPLGGGPNATGPFTIGFDNVVLGLGNSTYPTSGYITSSAFDTGKLSKMQVSEWNETLPVCSPACEIKLQARVALDNVGSPGVWTSWYGTSGVETYFTDSDGELMPVALNDYQWIQYRAELIGDGTDTPILKQVDINYK